MGQNAASALAYGTAKIGGFLWFVAAIFVAGHAMVGSPGGVRFYITVAVIAVGLLLNTVLLVRIDRMGRLPLNATVFTSLALSTIPIGFAAYIALG